MTFWTLIRRSLRFHARAHLGIVLGAAIGSAALIGALVVGDSVRESLADMALRRLGSIHFALSAQDRLFQASLARRVWETWTSDSTRVRSTTAASIHRLIARPQSSALALPGIVDRQDGTARANRVNVVGVEREAWPILANWRKLRLGMWVAGPGGGTPEQLRLSTMLFERGQSITARWNAGETAFINQALARQLAVREGDRKSIV